jgi:hypothetical protein
MKWRLRLVRRTLGGIDCDRPEVTVWVRSRYGDYDAIQFIVDTASDFTAIPISQAQKEGIAFPQSPTHAGRQNGGRQTRLGV